MFGAGFTTLLSSTGFLLVFSLMVTNSKLASRAPLTLEGENV